MPFFSSKCLGRGLRVPFSAFVFWGLLGAGTAVGKEPEKPLKPLRFGNPISYTGLPWSALTGAEKAIIYTFLWQDHWRRPQYRTFIDPRTLATKTSDAEVLEWQKEITEESLDRIQQFIPDLPTRLAEGRAARLRYFSEGIAEVKEDLRTLGVNPNICQTIQDSYTSLLKKYFKSTPPPELLIRQQAEQVVRKRYQIVLSNVASRYPARANLPMDQWPHEVVTAYQKEILRLEQRELKSSQAPTLPPTVYAQWRQWTLDRLSWGYSPRSFKNTAGAVYGGGLYELIDNQRAEWSSFLRGEFANPANQEGLQQKLSDRSMYFHEKIDQLEAFLFGDKERLNGNQTPELPVNT